MYTITIEDFENKILENTKTIDDKEISPPNGIVKEKGKPDIMWIYYNNRRYEWLLVI